MHGSGIVWVSLCLLSDVCLIKHFFLGTRLAAPEVVRDDPEASPGAGGGPEQAGTGAHPARVRTRARHVRSGPGVRALPLQGVQPQGERPMMEVKKSALENFIREIAGFFLRTYTLSLSL